jgi:hypothetical protein
MGAHIRHAQRSDPEVRAGAIGALSTVSDDAHQFAPAASVLIRASARLRDRVGRGARPQDIDQAETTLIA